MVTLIERRDAWLALEDARRLVLGRLEMMESWTKRPQFYKGMRSAYESVLCDIKRLQAEVSANAEVPR